MIRLFYHFVLIVVCSLVMAVSCGEKEELPEPPKEEETPKDEEPPKDEENPKEDEETPKPENVIKLSIPSTLKLETGDRECLFELLKGEWEANSKIIFEDADGVKMECSTGLYGNIVAVTLSGTLTPGDYKIYVKNSDGTKYLGATSYPIQADKFVPNSSTTVWGVVSCQNRPVANVVVSDGVETTTTDKSGFYQLASKKKYGYVFISTPRGYETPLTGVIPNFFKKTTSGSVNRLDFTLNKVDNDEFTLYILGDLHLANRMKSWEPQDVTKYRAFAEDLNRAKLNYSENAYVLTLGDMSWDQYWWINSFDLQRYLDETNRLFNMPFFHTMGNHDNDFTKAGDFNKENEYRKVIGPTYYSVNLGKVHLIVLDNIHYADGQSTDKDGNGQITGTDYRGAYRLGLTTDQYNWLQKDLKYVSKDTPIILAGHSQFNWRDSNGTWEAKSFHEIPHSSFLSALSGYKVHIFSGHTHQTANYDAMATKGIYEHNAGAVCAAWWWSDTMSAGVNIATDGSPGGYTILNANGKDLEWRYKPTGVSATHQFHAYDMNEVKKVIVKGLLDSSLRNEYASKFQPFVNAMQAYGSNEILLNIWNYAPDWKIEITENGKSLSYTTVYEYDPLHITAQSALKMNIFITEKSHHFFRVKTSSATSTIEIKVTDSFGRVYKETMTRPKEFSILNYRHI